MALIGSTMAVRPPAARAQRAPRVVGFLHSATSAEVVDLAAAFRTGLKESGFSEGQNVAIEYRWAENDAERLPALATSLVDQRVNIIAAAGGDRTAIAAKRATAEIPIVAVIGGDPVAEGLVASLFRPGGNLTGVSFLTANLTVKWLDLVLQLAPKIKIAALLLNPKNPQSSMLVDELQKVAISRGLEVRVVTASTKAEVNEAFVTMNWSGVGAVVVQADRYFNNVRSQLISLAAQYSLPAIYERRAFIDEGGLISYGPSLPDVYRQVGVYCGEILKGANPSELPVLQPTKFELVINLKTAKALGITVPPVLLAGADEVIE